MIKIIKKLTEDFSPLDIVDQRKQKETNRKVIHVLRVAKEAKAAAQEARKQGKNSLADQLEEQAQQLEDWVEGKYDSSVETTDRYHIQGKSKNTAEHSSDTPEATEQNKSANSDSNDLKTEKENSTENNKTDETEPKNSGSKSEENQKSTASNENRDSGESDEKNNSKDDNSEEDKSTKNNDLSDNDSSNEKQKDSDEDNKSNNETSEDESNTEAASTTSVTSITNPFDVDPKAVQKASSKMTNIKPAEVQEKNTKTELEQMQVILKMLKKGEKAGARDALTKILADKKIAKPTSESLQEKLIITKALDNIDNDSFNNIINQVLDTIDSIKPIQYEEPRPVRVDQIKGTVLNTQNIRDLNQEDKANLNKDIDPAIKVRERESQKYRVKNLPSTDVFKLDLYDAVRDQVDKIKKAKDSWGALNRRHQGTEILKPGSVIQGDWDEKKPLIQVYLDCSASFNYKDIQKERALLSVLAEFEAQDEIITQIYYFANNLHSDYESARNEGGTSAWDEIMHQVKTTDATNVLIITDSDMDYQVEQGGYWEVDGCVWYIWKDSKAVPMLTHLTGKQAVKEYQISW